MDMTKGFLIYIFGIDGCGKTTLLENLEKYLCDDTLFLRTFLTPCFMKELENVAYRLKDSRRNIFSQQLRSLVWMLDLLKVTNDVIIPNITAGKSVIVDRYSLCNRVYLEILNQDSINYMEQMLDKLPNPDMGLYLNVSIDEAIKRIQLRNKNIAPYEKKETLNKLKQRYEKLLLEEKYPIYTVDADQSEKEIFAKALEYINMCKGGWTHEGIKS